MNCFVKGSVVCNLESTEKFAAIHELIQRASIFKSIKNINAFEEVVFDREKQMTTGLGHGVAFAHGKTDIVDRIYIGLGISKKGIDFNAVNNQPVHLLFLLANPIRMENDYLQVMGALCKITREEDFLNKVITTKKSSAIEAIFKERFRKFKIC